VGHGVDGRAHGVDGQATVSNELLSHAHCYLKLSLILAIRWDPRLVFHDVDLSHRHSLILRTSAFGLPSLALLTT
jgi:hypothetical protein